MEVLLMKISTRFLSLICVLLLLSSCTSGEKSPSATTDAQGQPDQSNPATTDAPSDPDQGDVNPGYTETYRPYYNSLAEYEKMLRSTEVPGTFVTYDHLKFIGTFSYHTHNENNLKSDYRYTLINAGKRINIHFAFHEYWKNFENLPRVAASDQSDFRYQDNKDFVCVEHGKLEYWYAAGKLEYINFKWSELTVSLSVDNYLDCEKDTDSLVGRLLYADTAEAAAKVFLDANPFK